MINEFANQLWPVLPASNYRNAVDFNSTVEAARKEGWVAALKYMQLHNRLSRERVRNKYIEAMILIGLEGLNE